MLIRLLYIRLSITRVRSRHACTVLNMSVFYLDSPASSHTLPSSRNSSPCCSSIVSIIIISKIGQILVCLIGNQSRQWLGIFEPPPLYLLLSDCSQGGLF